MCARLQRRLARRSGLAVHAVALIGLITTGFFATDRSVAQPATTPSVSGDSIPAFPALPVPGIGFWVGRQRLTIPDTSNPAARSSPSETTVLVPLPPRRPPDFGGARTDDERVVDTSTGDCLARLRASGTAFKSVPSPPTGNAACRIDTPVQVTAIPVAIGGSSSITLPDRPIVACRLALAFGEWTRSAAALLGESRRTTLVAMTTGPGWECRSRNRQPGAPMSNHANGLALDVNTFVFADRRNLTVSGSAGDAGFAAIRTSACSHFSTVLGPGSDGFHQDHLHVDVVTIRRGRFKYCH